VHGADAFSVENVEDEEAQHVEMVSRSDEAGGCVCWCCCVLVDFRFVF
jgi:hypothetical protein